LVRRSSFFNSSRRCTSARSRKLSILAAFEEEGDADLSLDPALYGVTGGHVWALLQATCACCLSAPSCCAHGIARRQPDGGRRHLQRHPPAVDATADDDKACWVRII
jgi:hypothetical protein